MSEKRRDNKGRILKTGESQRKDGRYLYKYIDSFGEPQFVYSWKLVATDRVPAGKRDCISLREKIAELQKDIHDGIDVVGKKMTLCQLYAKQNAQRPKVRKNTETGRKYLMDILKKDKLGVRSIDSIKPSDAKEWAIRMSENGYAYQTINNYKRSLKASFYIAIQDDCVRKNPFDFQLKAVLDAASRTSLHFLPAFPKMNRITRNGIHYIDGVPVHESVFGKDPFEPVADSYIPEILKGDVPVTVVRNMKDWKRAPGIMVYDASTDQELMEFGKFLMKKGELTVMAGCAGFAGV